MKYFFLYITIVNHCYQKQKERLWKEAHEKYQNLSEEEINKKLKKAWEKYQNLTDEEKEKKLHYHLERNKNLSEEQRKKLVEYRRNDYVTYNK